jgi:hypothetical protein
MVMITLGSHEPKLILIFSHFSHFFSLQREKRNQGRSTRGVAAGISFDNTDDGTLYMVTIVYIITNDPLFNFNQQVDSNGSRLATLHDRVTASWAHPPLYYPLLHRDQVDPDLMRLEIRPTSYEYMGEKTEHASEWCVRWLINTRRYVFSVFSLFLSLILS